MKDVESVRGVKQHTPGPWELRERAHEATPYSKRRVYRMEVIAPQYLYGKRTHSRDIAQILDYCEWTDHPANARLIAAAPELLSALELAAATCYEADINSGEDGGWLTVARAAIRKARGE